MHRRFGILGLTLASLMLAAVAHASEPGDFDPKEIRAATTKLIAALEDPDPTAWVYMYTEDAGLLEAGSKPLEGRAHLLELARSMQPMSSVVITPSRTEVHGSIAYMYGTASWVNGRPPEAGSKSQVHLVMCGARNRTASGGWPWATMRRHAQLFTDTSWQPVDAVRAAIAEVGADRILLGSDWPLLHADLQGDADVQVQGPVQLR